MYIQFLEDMCTSVLGVLTYEEVLGERSTRENDLLWSVLVTRGGAFLVIQSIRKYFMVCSPMGKYNLLGSFGGAFDVRGSL